MVNFLNVIRWKNLLIIALLLVAQKYLVFESYLHHLLIGSEFSSFEFSLLVLSIVLIAAGGYLLNDITDVKIDAVNKPQKNMLLDVKSPKYKSIYYLLSISGIVIALLIGYHLGEYQLAYVHIISVGLLYLYSTTLKKIVGLGTITIGFLSALVPFTYFLFEAYSFLGIHAQTLNLNYINIWEKGPLGVLFKWMLFYSVFAFILTLAREIIKDIEDQKGDEANQRVTLPILIGKKKAMWVVLVVLLISCFLINTRLSELPFGEVSINLILFLQGYIWLILGGSIVFILTHWKLKKLNATLYSKVLKITMLLGILSSLIVSALL